MSNISSVPEKLPAGRGDPVYMAHAYLTKVPVPAIMPLVEAYTEPGGVVLDPFAGSGMTGVAAFMLGRSARLSDISVLGKHIGCNYVNIVDSNHLAKAGAEVVAEASARLRGIYSVSCDRCGRESTLAKSVWSFLVQCSNCGTDVNYYKRLEAADWVKRAMTCQRCDSPVSSKNPRRGEERVLDYVRCDCSSTQIEQAPHPERADREWLRPAFPNVEITPDRQMYQASALGKNGYTTVASFYSPRNTAALAVLHEEISRIDDEAIRNKLLFAFTASLTRASKRYQWSKQRPLNAANANYYVAPVFYEWNVFELFSRKVGAAEKADSWISSARTLACLKSGTDASTVTYVTESAESLSVASGSIDYVFTDPPFGSNLFYADMALFQEGWLEGFTSVEQEAVIDRSRKSDRTASRYERLLRDALSEMARVLRPGGHASMVFGNSSGSVWALVQRAIRDAGMVVVPEALAVLDKGQRSVKGLASGFEDVATLDLIITMRPSTSAPAELRSMSENEVVAAARRLCDSTEMKSPSHLYLELLRTGFRENWLLGELDLRTVTSTLIQDGWSIDSKSGLLHRGAPERLF